jgi:hypothetical protein
VPYFYSGEPAGIIKSLLSLKEEKMSKGMDRKKQTKKAPSKTMKEKKAEKKAKKETRGFSR